MRPVAILLATGLGLRPRLVPGSARNIKVTFAGDAAIAAQLLKDGA